MIMRKRNREKLTERKRDRKKKIKESAEEGSLSTRLQNDLMEEIMSRLPVQSLLRFKTVSKSWYALVTTDRYFIGKQLCQTPNTDNDLVMLIKDYVGPGKICNQLYVFSLVYYSSETGCVKCINLDNQHFLKRLNMPEVDITCPCNGIVCVTRSDNPRQVYLWNPSVGGGLALPVSPRPRPHPNFDFYLHGSMGLGFDNKSNSYKVIRIWIFRKTGGIERTMRVEICRLSDNPMSWIEIDATPLTRLPPGPLFDPVYADGKCYWIIWNKLVWFNFADEVFEEIELPNAPGIFDREWGNIVALNNSIALTNYSPIEEYFDVWLMNKELPQLSWTKYMTVKSDMLPLRFLANGDVVLYDHKMLHLYNSATREIKTLEIEFSCLEKIVIYNESLVSLKEEENT